MASRYIRRRRLFRIAYASSGSPMQKSYLMGTQDPHLLRTMRESGRRPNTAVGEATGTAEGQGAGSGNVPVEVYSRGSLGLVGDDFGTIFGHRPKAASGEREPLYTRVRNCLPRLNQACPNPSKWRESLGFASWARGQCSGHCGDAHPGVPPRPRTPIMMAPCRAARLPVCAVCRRILSRERTEPGRPAVWNAVLGA